MKMKRNKNFFPAFPHSLVGGVLLSIGVVASCLLPAGVVWGNNFIGNYELTKDYTSLVSGVKVTLSESETKAEATGKSTVTVSEAPTWSSVYGVYTWDSNLNVIGNIVSIGAGTVATNVYGGASSSSNVMGNKVTLTSGTINSDIYGGYSGTATAGGSEEDAGNKVEITGGIVTGSIYGGVSNNSTAISNTVTVGGGEINGSVFGGQSYSEATTSNAVIIDSGEVNGSVYGGYSNSSTAKGNTVTVAGGTVGSNVYGGASSSSNVMGNKVTLTSGTINSDIYGGYSETATAGGSEEDAGNKVEITGGTVTGSIYGGVSNSSIATSNTVTVGGGEINGSVFGGQSYSEAITGNAVIIDSGEVNDSVYGGYSSDGTAKSNIVTVTGGTVGSNVYGGASSSSDATGNTVTLTSGTINSDIYGGYSETATAGGSEEGTGNKVEITGGTVTGSIYGGASGSSNAMGNTVTVGGGKINGSVFGGQSYSEATTSNVVIIDSGEVNGFVYGGYSSDGTAKSNIVTVTGGTVGSNVYGGASSSSDATGNTVTLTSGTINSDIYGGYSETATAGGSEEGTGNKVEITGGTVTGSIYGGASNSSNAMGNMVTVTGGTLAGIIGGASNSSNATSNTVTVTGGTLAGIIGGASTISEVANNTVNVTGGTVNGDIYGGYSESGAVTGGTVNINGTDVHITGTVYGGHGTSVSGTTVNWTQGTVDGDVVANTVNIKATNDVMRSTKQKITAATITVERGASLTQAGSFDLTNTTKLTVAGTLIVEEDITYNKATDSIVANGGNVTAASTSFVDNNITALTVATNAFATDKDTTLNVIFDPASNTTYTTAQLMELKKAYYTTLSETERVDAKLNLINATLKIDDDKEQMVIKRDSDSTGTTITIGNTPEVVDKNNNVKKTGVQSIPESYAQVVQQTTGSAPTLQKVSEVTIKSDFAAKGLEVASDSGKVSMVVEGNVIMVGGSTKDSSIVIDKDEKALATTVKVAENGYLQIGVLGNTAEQKGTIAQLTVKGEHSLVGNGAATTDYTYENLITESKGSVLVTNAALVVGQLKAPAGVLFVDPAYLGVYAVGNSATIGSDLYVGAGSVVNIEGDSAELKKIAQDLKLNVKDASTGFTVGADETMLGLEGNYTLSSGARLIVDSAVDSTGADANNSNGRDVYFGDKSVLVVNGSNINSGTAALTLSGQSVDVASDAKLYLRNALSKKTYTILSDADENNITVAGWGNDGGKKTGETTLYANRLLKYTTKVANGSYIIFTSPDLDPNVFQSTFVYPALKEIADNNLLNADSSYGGIKFLSRATDATYIGDAQMTPVMEEMAAIATTAGVQHTALRASDLVVDTIGEHLTAAKADKGANLWATPLRTSLTTTNRTESTANISGIMVGYDKGNEKGRFGVAIQGGWGTSHSEGTVSYYQNKNKFAGVSLYGSRKIGKFDLKASLGYTKFSNDVRTHLASGLNMGLVNTDIDAKAFTADVQVERTYDTKSGLGITPHVGLRFTRLATDSYDNYILSGDSEKQNIWQLPIGVTFAQTLTRKEGWTLKPYLDLSFVPAFGGKEADSRVRFTGLSSVVSSATRIIDSTSFLGSLGFTAESGKFGMGLNYSLQKGGSETNSTVSLNLNWKF